MSRASKRQAPPRAASPPKTAARWLLLVHQLPPRPPYLRAKIAQRLAGVGALALKNSVYLLPERDDCREDFEWIAKQAVAGGGQAWIGAVEWLAGTGDEALRAAFLAQAERGYDELAGALRSELAGRRPGDLAARGELAPLLADWRIRLARLARRDRFAAPGGAALEAWLHDLEARGERRAKGGAQRLEGFAELRGKVWVTRRDVFVDRIATAWLVRRFVDPEARFRFVAAASAPARPGEVRFDMGEAEVTHQGERCTFEVLFDRLGLEDRALRKIAEMVHDIDLKDDKHGHPETAGLEQMLVGMAALERQDEQRLEKGFALFDGLYRALALTPSRPTSGTTRRRR